MRSPLLVASFLSLAACGSAFATCEGCPDWLFARGDYTHDPASGVRVAQYAPLPSVEPLPDPRATVSRYWNTRTQLRGAYGSGDTVYEVHSFGNTRGGYDAQMERAFDASLTQLSALRPFRHNPWLFYGSGLGGGGYGYGQGGYGPGGYGPGGYGPGGYGYGGGPVPNAEPGGFPGPQPGVGFPPFGVPTQPYGGAGFYGPPIIAPYYGFSPFGHGPYGYGPPAYGPPAYGPPSYGPWSHGYGWGHAPAPHHGGPGAG